MVDLENDIEHWLKIGLEYRAMFQQVGCIMQEVVSDFAQARQADPINFAVLDSLLSTPDILLQQHMDKFPGGRDKCLAKAALVVRTMIKTNHTMIILGDLSRAIYLGQKDGEIEIKADYPFKIEIERVTMGRVLPTIDFMVSLAHIFASRQELWNETVAQGREQGLRLFLEKVRLPDMELLPWKKSLAEKIPDFQRDQETENLFVTWPTKIYGVSIKYRYSVDSDDPRFSLLFKKMA